HRLVPVHQTEQDRSTDILGPQRTRDHRGKNIQGRGFAATRSWRKKVETRTQMKRSKGVGMDAPQCKSIRSAKRQHHVSGVAAGNLVQELRTVHRLRTRLGGWK